MKIIPFFIILFLKQLYLLAQAPDIEWQRSYGGSSIDEAFSLDLTLDGGYVIAGHSSSYDGDITFHYGLTFDYWIVKADLTGEIEWEKSLGGYLWDYARCIEQTKDSGYIVAGWTYSESGDVTVNYGESDMWIVKLSASGDIEWEKSFGGSSIESAWTIFETEEQDFIILGSAWSADGDITENHGLGDIWILKITEFGEIIWENCYGGSNHDYARTIIPTTDGGYAVCGQTGSFDGDVTFNHGEDDIWLLKLNFEGEIEWQKSYGGLSQEMAEDIQQTQDGGYIIAAYTSSIDGDISENHGATDSWILKINPDGNLDWEKSYGGSAIDAASNIKQTFEGGYIFSGTTYSTDGDITGNNGDSDGWVVKISNEGEVEWQKCLGSTQYDVISQINQIADGGFIITAYSSENDGDVTGNHGSLDYWIVKLGPSCSASATIDSCNNIDDNCNGLVDEDAIFINYYADEDSDGFGDVNNEMSSCQVLEGFVSDSTDCDDTNSNIYPGAMELYNGLDDNCDGFAESVGNLEFEFNNTIDVYPNPASEILYCNYSGNTNLQVQIISITGEILYQKGINASTSFDISKYNTGLYMLKINSNSSIISIKFVKE